MRATKLLMPPCDASISDAVSGEATKMARSAIDQCEPGTGADKAVYEAFRDKLDLRQEQERPFVWRGPWRNRTVLLINMLDSRCTIWQYGNRGRSRRCRRRRPRLIVDVVVSAMAQGKAGENEIAQA